MPKQPEIALTIDSTKNNPPEYAFGSSRDNNEWSDTCDEILLNLKVGSMARLSCVRSTGSEFQYYLRNAKSQSI